MIEERFARFARWERESRALVRMSPRQLARSYAFEIRMRVLAARVLLAVALLGALLIGCASEPSPFVAPALDSHGRITHPENPGAVWRWNPQAQDWRQ